MNDYECEAQNNDMKVGLLCRKKAKTILNHSIVANCIYLTVSENAPHQSSLFLC